MLPRPVSIWYGTKERSTNTNTAAKASPSEAYWPLASRDLQIVLRAPFDHGVLPRGVCKSLGKA
jgi:hypothetical protein